MGPEMFEPEVRGVERGKRVWWPHVALTRQPVLHLADGGDRRRGPSRQEIESGREPLTTEADLPLARRPLVPEDDAAIFTRRLALGRQARAPAAGVVARDAAVAFEGTNQLSLRRVGRARSRGSLANSRSIAWRVVRASTRVRSWLRIRARVSSAGFREDLSKPGPLRGREGVVERRRTFCGRPQVISPRDEMRAIALERSRQQGIELVGHLGERGREKQPTFSSD